ncbi:MAG: CoA-transferase subunit beta [Gammaproteobacteria bacterium]|nr:MAG: CoA-transferase subunit beta [Gammaproteobacteria bacterium]
MADDWRNSPPATDYTVDELMIAVLAAEFQDGDQVTNGMASFLPVAAFMLARQTHAPELVWLASSVGLDPRPERIPASTLEAPLWRDSIMYLEQYEDFWSYVQNGRYIRKFCVGAAQIDQYGNVNNSVIGDDYHAPRVRLPGTAGLADLCAIGKQLYYWQPRHSPRSLVERVDFISGAGYLGGGSERAELGLAAGPELVVSNLAVMDFHPDSKRMRLRSLHPGVGLAEVRAATGFELLLPDGEIPRTAAPTVAQVRLIRERIDPAGMRKREFRQGRTSAA